MFGKVHLEERVSVTFSVRLLGEVEEANELEAYSEAWVMLMVTAEIWTMSQS